MSSSTHASLDAQATERKARLAQLKSLKRKQPSSDGPSEEPSTIATITTAEVDKDGASTLDVSTLYLSGRNYDASTRGPKLGFESAPIESTATLEEQAATVAETTKAENEDDAGAATDEPIDLFKLQPKKPNWDLKRDLQRKLDVLSVRTENAIARLVREKIEAARERAKIKGSSKGEGGGEAGGEEVGMDGTTLVEGVHAREREEVEEKRRALDDDDDDA
jgi:coiled-coil domain-containing protein 12